MRSFFALILVFFFFCSCSSRIPEPVGYQYSQQKKMQAASHWQVLAADLANRINNQLIMTENINKSVFVKQTCGDEAAPANPMKPAVLMKLFGIC